MIKVFLVEDEYVIREGIKKNIDWQAHGYEFCGEAGDGELAFPMIQEIRPDIVITDIRMPFMDGLALSRLIKKEFPETEIIILSGYEEFEYAKEGIKIGVAQYLLKPISGDALIKEIDLVAASIEERKQKERIRERYFKQSMDRESEKDNLNIQELDYKQFEKSKLQEFMKVGCKEEVPYFIDEMFQKLDHSAVKSRIFRQYIVMDAYFCVAEFVEEIGLSRDEVEPMDVASDVLSSIEYSKEYIVRIIQKAIDEIVGTFYRQTLFAEYEYLANKEVAENKPINHQVLSQIMIDLYKKYYGLDITKENLKQYVWAYIPHLFYTPFYVYQYATSFAASFKLYKDVKENVPGAFEKYTNLLKSGGSKYPVEQVKEAGVDFTKKDAYMAVVERMETLVDELEKLLEE